MPEQTPVERKIWEIIDSNKYNLKLDNGNYDDLENAFIEMAQWAVRESLSEKMSIYSEDSHLHAEKYGFNRCREKIISNAKSLGIDIE